MAIIVTINGQDRSIRSEPGTPLLWVLRDELGLTGTKYGCGVAACGACTVHIDGEPVRSCQTFVEDLEGSQVTTIEAVGDAAAEAVQSAWAELDVVQCGYCQSGQIMSAISLLSSSPTPSDDDIRGAMFGNVCRCATYPRIHAAIKRASQILEAQS